MLGFTRATAYPQVATVLVDDALGNPKSQACAVDAFGAVKRFKDVLEHLGSHPASSISNGDHRSSSSGAAMDPIPGAQRECATQWHCCKSISDEVVQDLPDISIEAGTTNIVLKVTTYCYPPLSHAVLRDIQNFLNKLSWVKEHRLGRLPMKSQRLSCDVRNAAKLSVGGSQIVL